MFKRILLVFGAVLGLFLVAGFLNTPVKAIIPPLVTTYDFITTDNGMQGLWATDNFHSTVTITPSEDCYKVVREDGGTFSSLDGAKSPGGKDGTLIGNGTTGTISGGLTEIICGELRPTPLPNDTPEDVRGSYPEPKYENRYFHRYFSEIISGNITNWGWTFTTCNNGTWVDNERTEALYNSDGPNSTMGDVKGEFIPCRQEPTPTPAPTAPSCGSDEHVDLSGTKCLRWELGGPPPPPPAGGGQVQGISTQSKVLGASTMAGTGTFEENLYMAIMGIGGTLTAFGFKSIKKTSKKA